MAEDDFPEPIYSYTRKQAIEDGVLIDVTKTAREAGFKFHTVVTDGVWHDYVAVDENLKQIWGQSEEGRLWDVIWMASVAARKAPAGEDIVPFEFLVRQRKKVEKAKLWLHIGPGDKGEPVLTIMRPEDY